MATNWLIDGMNVVGSRPTGWWRDRPRAMRELVQELEALAKARPGDRVTVVFDGAPFAAGEARVEVRFASRRGPNAADDDIAELAGEGHTVVTSDGDLARRARANGARVEGAGTFRRLLDGLAGPNPGKGGAIASDSEEKAMESSEEQGQLGSEESAGGDFGGEPGTSGESGGGGSESEFSGGSEGGESGGGSEGGFSGGSEGSSSEGGGSEGAEGGFSGGGESGQGEAGGSSLGDDDDSSSEGGDGA